MQNTNLKNVELENLDSSVEFYEGKWTKTDYSLGRSRNFLIKKQRFFLRELNGENGTLLDLGCGGGWIYLTRFERVIGLDLSYSSLQNARQIYSSATQGSVIKLPFADNSLDFVVSLDVLGHIALKNKAQLITEIWRVLKPGGKTVHYIETLSNDPLSTFARRHPDLYDRHFVAPEGHIGIEPPGPTFERFRQAGFTPIREVAAYKGFIYLERFIQYFDNEYKEKSKLMQLLVTVLKPFAGVRPLRIITNIAITLCFEIFDPLLPRSWAGGALVSYRKN